MAKITQRTLFTWEDIEATDELRRLDLVLDALPDEGLVSSLEVRRGRGRDDYPVRCVWNALIAGIVFGHKDVESLRRELARNPALRARCGFALRPGARAVPSSNAFSNFLTSLLESHEAVEEMFHRLVDELAALLPDLGQRLAIDGKAVQSFARGPSFEETQAAAKTPRPVGDRRRDDDAEWGIKKHLHKRTDGSTYEKITKWFGYRLHLLVDSTHELPLWFEVTKAPVGEQPKLVKSLEELEERHPGILERAKELSADKGYDTIENFTVPWDRYGIRPVIDVRHLWQGGDPTRPLFDQNADTVVYDQDGGIFCICPVTQLQRPMVFQGLEADRDTLKYRCPVAALGGVCKGRDECPGARSAYGRVIRIPLDRDRRIFTPLARSAKTWKRAYAHRTAVERVNGRFDQLLGFERHTIRGLRKMQVRTGLALAVMLATALGWLRANRPEMIRSLLGTVRPKRKVA